ncbi:hypothetical protein KEM55_001427 [Ascosphaera atra]|nr:hypothetical protein KEM55_001427 [Ascosphaera atra]
MNHMVNEDCCMRDLLLDYFEKPSRYRIAKEQRQRCCAKCNPHLDYGIIGGNKYPWCYLYHEQGSKGGKDALKVRKVAIYWASREAAELSKGAFYPLDNHTLILCASELRALQGKYYRVFLHNSLRVATPNWEYMEQYGEELLRELQEVIVNTPSATAMSLIESSRPKFQTALQDPAHTQPHRKDVLQGISSATDASTSASKKRSVLGDITNIADSNKRRQE